MKRITFLLLIMLCAINLKAQNLRIIEGSVQDYRGNTIANATVNIFGTNKIFKCDENGNFSIEVPIQTFGLIASSEGYQSKYLEVDGTYMLFILRPKTQKEIAWEEQQVQFAKQKEIEANNKVKKKEQLIAQKEAEAKAKAEEQVRMAIQREAEAKAKAEEQVRMAIQREAEARAKTEEQARITAQKEAETVAKAKVKAEEQARITAQKEAETVAKAKAKAEKQAKLATKKAAREQFVDWLEAQRATQAEILEQRQNDGYYE